MTRPPRGHHPTTRTRTRPAGRLGLRVPGALLGAVGLLLWAVAPALAETLPPVPGEGPSVLEPDAAAWKAAPDDPLSWIIAVAVLAASLLIVAALARRSDSGEDEQSIPPNPWGGVVGEGDPAEGLAALEAVGEAMIDAGYSVTGVRSALVDIARVNGFPATEIVVLPTALIISARGSGTVSTGAVSSGHESLRLNQIDALDDVILAARRRPLDPAATRAAVLAVRDLPSPYTRAQRVVAYAMLSGGISVLLGGSMVGVAVAAALGLAVGLVYVLSEEVGQYRALVTVGLAFGVSLIVFTLTNWGIDPGVLAALIAPLVILLPGGLLTTGVIELTTGQMMAGAGRLAAGTMQLVLLSVGLVAGSTLAGVPTLELVEAQEPIGPLGPWLAVAVFGIGIVVFQCGRPRSIAWVLLVLYVAYGAQVIGDIFFGGVLSAMIGAFVMTPVAYLVSSRPSGPAAFASFLPAFWLLVPGALGLVGVAGILEGDSAGTTTLVTTAATMVAIALGILAGSPLGSRLAKDGVVVAV